MPSRHIVSQGECLSSIAREYGLPSWRTIYDAPENAEFRKLRPNPNVIQPGDKLVIPDPARGEKPAPVEKRHKYRIRREITMLRILLMDEDGSPYAGKPYRLEVAGLTLEGKTGSDGLVEREVPAAATEGALTAWLTDDRKRAYAVWNVLIGALDPVERLTGVQARLNNLGFDSGKVDGLMGPITEGAVRRFQEQHRLRVDGIPGRQTQSKLKEIHGC